jgi:hypothetical protein
MEWVSFSVTGEAARWAPAYSSPCAKCQVVGVGPNLKERPFSRREMRRGHRFVDTCQGVVRQDQVEAPHSDPHGPEEILPPTPTTNTCESTILNTGTGCVPLAAAH